MNIIQSIGSENQTISKTDYISEILVRHETRMSQTKYLYLFVTTNKYKIRPNYVLDGWHQFRFPNLGTLKKKILSKTGGLLAARQVIFLPASREAKLYGRVGRQPRHSWFVMEGKGEWRCGLLLSRVCVVWDSKTKHSRDISFVECLSGYRITTTSKF